MFVNTESHRNKSSRGCASVLIPLHRTARTVIMNYAVLIVIASSGCVHSAKGDGDGDIDEARLQAETGEAEMEYASYQTIEEAEEEGSCRGLLGEVYELWYAYGETCHRLRVQAVKDMEPVVCEL